MWASLAQTQPAPSHRPVVFSIQDRLRTTPLSWGSRPFSEESRGRWSTAAAGLLTALGLQYRKGAVAYSVYLRDRLIRALTSLFGFRSYAPIRSSRLVGRGFSLSLPMGWPLAGVRIESSSRSKPRRFGRARRLRFGELAQPGPACCRPLSSLPASVELGPEQQRRPAVVVGLAVKPLARSQLASAEHSETLPKMAAALVEVVGRASWDPSGPARTTATVLMSEWRWQGLTPLVVHQVPYSVLRLCRFVAVCEASVAPGDLVLATTAC